jgi:hypothetical protein
MTKSGLSTTVQSVEALVRDNSGNWFSLCQRAK